KESLHSLTRSTRLTDCDFQILELLESEDPRSPNSPYRIASQGRLQRGKKHHRWQVQYSLEKLRKLKILPADSFRVTGEAWKEYFQWWEKLFYNPNLPEALEKRLPHLVADAVRTLKPPKP